MRVVSRRRWPRVLPASDDLDAAEARTGFRVEVRDPGDRARYVRFLPDPRATDVEVPPEDDDGPFTRTRRPRRPGTFAVLVPDLPDGGDVVLARRRAGPAVAALQDEEVARFPLRGHEGPAGRRRVQPESSCNQIVGRTTIRNHGPDPDRWNVVVVGDGYRDDELESFAWYADRFADHLFDAAPFRDLRDGINVHRVDVASCESGADHPDGCDDGVEVDTYFDATYCGDPDWPDRLLVVDTEKVIDVLEREVPDWDVGLVIVNATPRGGSGDDLIPVVSRTNHRHVALHELGHSAFGLADEYDFHYGPEDERDFEDPDYRRYDGSEPEEANLTAGATRADAKWGHLIPAGADLPTAEKEDCEESDWGSRNPAPLGTVGLFEGAGFHRCGLYRAQFTCRMRESRHEFCVVCQEHIRDVLAPFDWETGEVEGTLTFLRAHDVGTRFGPDDDQIDVEVVVRLDTAPERAFGFPLRTDTHEAARRRMLDTLRTAFSTDRRVRIAYQIRGGNNGELLAVEALERSQE